MHNYAFFAGVVVQKTDLALKWQKKNALSGDALFRGITFGFAFSILVILGLMLGEMVRESLPALRVYGWGFLGGSTWDAVNEEFAALPFIYGSVVSALLALCLATPLSIATALFITEV